MRPDQNRRIGRAGTVLVRHSRLECVFVSLSKFMLKFSCRQSMKLCMHFLAVVVLNI